MDTPKVTIRISHATDARLGNEQKRAPRQENVEGVKHGHGHDSLSDNMKDQKRAGQYGSPARELGPVSAYRRLATPYLGTELRVCTLSPAQACGPMPGTLPSLETDCHVQ